MVTDRITDGYRVAELLASEVDGRQSGPLGRLAVTDPDRTIEGSPEGERAYDVRWIAADADPRREPRPEDVGDVLARVFVHEAGVTLAIQASERVVSDATDDVGLERADPPAVDEGAWGVAVPSGAAVKRGIDVLASVVEATGAPDSERA